MNFLAHFYLSQNNEALIVGNFLANQVKGRNFEGVDKNIIQGVLHHRFIDNFTDTHPNVLLVNSLFRPNQGKFSGVASDILFDHILAQNWANYSDISLTSFTQNIYQILNLYQNQFEAFTLLTYQKMMEHNWLFNYQFEEGVKRALFGMSKRSRFENNLANAFSDYQSHKQEVDNLFFEFFEDFKIENERFIHQLFNNNSA